MGAKVVSNNRTIVREKTVVKEGYKKEDIESLAKSMAKEMAGEMLQELLAKLPQGVYPVGGTAPQQQGVQLDESIADVTTETEFKKSADLGKTKVSKEKATGKANKLKAFLNKKK